MACTVYDRFGYRDDPELEQKMVDWLKNHPSDRHGRHTYELSDFGLTENDVHRRLEDESFEAAQ
jgi:hypothetical protein